MFDGAVYTSPVYIYYVVIVDTSMCTYDITSLLYQVVEAHPFGKEGDWVTNAYWKEEEWITNAF